jgi:hypothetical protein
MHNPGFVVDHIRQTTAKPLDEVRADFERRLGRFDASEYQALAAGETPRRPEPGSRRWRGRAASCYLGRSTTARCSGSSATQGCPVCRGQPALCDRDDVAYDRGGPVCAASRADLRGRRRPNVHRIRPAVVTLWAIRRQAGRRDGGLARPQTRRPGVRGDALKARRRRGASYEH